ncbi:FLYWCH zinc finger domain containing protein [Aphelenchoides avenae]|nr:FLYWCH zinc finger domain containing protein [Aphelenchus avenae]
MTAIIPLDWSATATPDAQEEEPISEMDMGDEDHIEAMEAMKPAKTVTVAKPIVASEKPTPVNAAEEPTEKAPSRNGTPASDEPAPTNKSDAMKFYDAGYLFLRDKQSTDGTRLFWRCNQKHHGCPARLHTLAATGQVLERHKGHNHSNLREIHMGPPSSEKRTHRLLDELRLDRPPRSISQPPNGGEAVSSFGRILRRRSPSFTPTEPASTRNVRVSS